MESVVKKVLLSREDIEKRVGELGREIADDYRGQNLLVVGILKGSVIFMSELVQKMDIAVEMDFMDVSSYGNSSESTGDVRILKDLSVDIKDKNILIVEDIIDTGYTLEYLKGVLKGRGAKSVKICTFLDKIERREIDVPVDYIGYKIENEFLVGYGLDYAEKYRNLPYIAALKEEVYMD